MTQQKPACTCAQPLIACPVHASVVVLHPVVTYHDSHSNCDQQRPCSTGCTASRRLL